MTNKHYVFHDASYWAGCGCDCCEDVYMDGYDCTSHEELYWTFSPGSVPAIYKAVIWHCLGYDLQDYEFLETTPQYTMTTDELLAEALRLGITVEIV